MSNRLAIMVLLASGAASLQPPPPVLAIVHARVFTGDTAHPWAEAIAIRGNRIVAVGTTGDVQQAAPAGARTIDANGQLLIPGFNDAHAHPYAMPDAVALEGPPPMEHDPGVDELLARVRAAAAKAKPGQWITGEVGAALFADPRATRATFDPPSAGHPLVLSSWTGHASLYNSAALQQLRVDDRAVDPPGGAFGRLRDGTLDGIAREYAQYRLGQRMSMLPDAAAQRSALERFTQTCAAFGITSVQAMMTGYESVGAVPLWNAAALSTRIRLIDFPLMSMAAWRRPAATGLTMTSPLVTMSGTKWILDGTPVERGAATEAPYADDARTSGRLNFTPADVRDFLQRAFEAHEQPIVHAVGDQADRIVLDALEATGGERWKARRPRIEHADLLSAADTARAARMGVFVVQNPAHFMIAPIARLRLGEARMARMQQVKAILAAGVPFAIGGDGVTNPFLNIMFAGSNAINPSQALSVEQVLRAYTQGSATAEFAEHEKGTIAVGMLADVALLSQDIFRIPAADLPRTVSVLTIVDGRIVHEQPPAADRK